MCGTTHRVGEGADNGNPQDESGKRLSCKALTANNGVAAEVVAA